MTTVLENIERLKNEVPTKGRWHHLGFGPKADEKDIREAEESIGRALPAAYKELLTQAGPFSLCRYDEISYEEGDYRMLTLSEALEITRIEQDAWRKEKADDETTAAILENCFFFQFGYREGRGLAFLYTPKAPHNYLIVNFDHDTGLLTDHVINSFEEYFDGFTEMLLEQNGSEYTLR